MQQKGLCLTCHTIGKTEGTLRFPDLAGVGDRAKTRSPGSTDIQYFAETLYHPDAFIVPGFSPGMPTINKPPIGLTDKEILCVIAWLQSLGGDADDHDARTKLPYCGGLRESAGRPANPRSVGAAASAARRRARLGDRVVPSGCT